MPVRRVDVLSSSGGVGKSLLACHLARLQAAAAKAPVLLVDADISGPCLGSLFYRAADWEQERNLIHLICGRPELLPEELTPGQLPIYFAPDATRAAGAPVQVAAPVSHGAVVFCPSHSRSRDLGVAPAVLHAMLGHESAGGWIGYVIQQVIDATNKLMNGRLAGVLVDHGPTMSALPSSTILECGAEGRRALIVTSLNALDLVSVRDLARDMIGVPKLLRRTVWVVNRIPERARADWRERIRRGYPRDAWYERALPVYRDPGCEEIFDLADIDMTAETALDPQLEDVRHALFDDGAPGRLTAPYAPNPVEGGAP